MSGNFKLLVCRLCVCWAVLCAAVDGFSQAQDPLLGQRVFFKDTATAKVDNKIVDKYKVLTWPALVMDVDGDWLWLRQAWVERSQVMLLDEAFDYYDKEVRRNPNSAHAWQRRGTCWAEREEYDKAIKDFSEAIRLDPSHVLAQLNRGNAKRELQDNDGAIADYDEAIRLDPKFVPAYNDRGVAKNHKQDYDGAIADFGEAIRLDPRLALAYYNRGFTQTKTRHYEEAIKDFDEAIRLEPEYAMAYNNRGLVKCRLKEFEAAISDFDQLIRLDPTFANSYYVRAYAKFQTQDYDGAINDLGEAIRLDPKLADAYFSRGVAKNHKQDYDGAIKDFDEAIRLNPIAPAYDNRGRAKFDKQDYDGAIKDYDEAIRLNPKSAKVHHRRALTLFLMRHADATESFQSVIDVEGWRGELATYSVIRGCLSGRMMQQPERAARYLADSQGQLKEEWPYPIVRYLRHELDEAGLLELATDAGKLTEVHCYVGLDLLAKGDTAAAKTHLEWVRDHGKKTFTEYDIAIAELRRLHGQVDKTKNE